MVSEINERRLIVNRHDYEYHENGFRVIKLPDWTKSLNNKAALSAKEIADILGLATGGQVSTMVRWKTFPESDCESPRKKFNGVRFTPKMSCWSVGLLRSLEKKSATNQEG